MGKIVLFYLVQLMLLLLLGACYVPGKVLLVLVFTDDLLWAVCFIGVTLGVKECGLQG